jgi:hypothetical protein
MSPLRRLTTRFASVFSIGIGLLLAFGMVASSTAMAEPLPPFGLEFFNAGVADETGLDDTAAGGHPFQSTNAFEFTHNGEISAEDLKSGYTELPPGFLGNPATAAFGSLVGELKLGTASSPPGREYGESLQGFPIENVSPDFGFPAQFFVNIYATPVTLQAILHPRSDSYAITLGSRDARFAGLTGIRVSYCGYGDILEIVGGNIHLSAGCHEAGEPGALTVPFLSNPVDCSGAELPWKLAASTWQHPGSFLPGGLPDRSNPEWMTPTKLTPAITGCDNPELAAQFDATSVATKPLQGPGPVQADSPSGLAIDLDFPQSNDPTDPQNTTYDPSIPQAPEPKDITLKLPAGLSISPSSADGLEACSDLASDPAGDQVHYDTTKPVTCPDASKIGTAMATSPLLPTRDPQNGEVNGAAPIPGDVYLLKPHPGDLPVGGNGEGKFRLLIQLENARYGTNIKLPGVATADPKTGQLTAVFNQNPQLPSKHLTVDLKEGPRAPLMTPVTCGKYTTDANLVPWGAPEVPDANKSASFEVKSGPNGSACSASEGARPFAPALATAGTKSARAGASSPLTLRIDRQDGEKELSKLDITLPEGLSAKLAGIPYCSDQALAAAESRTGEAEQANPTCPASRIGTVKVGAGPGSDPFFAQGSAYLAGPYKGAPLSVAVITPTVAGPFDLGAIVTRNALFLNPATAQAHVVSDPLPTMLDGIPLRLRSIIVELDKPDFTLNPTDCEPTAINATLTATDGTSTSRSQFFQASGCKDLGFKPNLKLSLKGKVSRRSHPSLHAHLTGRPGDANIASAQVRLPKAAFLDNAHIGDVCTRVQFAAKACPPGSVYGTATATTPLLGYTLTGNVYLRSSDHKLPDLVAGFNGPSSQPIEVELAGKTDSVKGALRNTFEAVPDVPVTDFDLTLFGGKKGLIVMSSGFCKDPRADIKLAGQNGAEFDTTPKVAAKCPKAKKGGKASKKGKGNRVAKRSLPAFLLKSW